MSKVVKRKDESTEALIKRFKKAVQNDGIMQEVRRREYYLSPSMKKRRKHELALKRLRKKNKNRGNN